MGIEVLIDNDVLIKSSIFLLNDELIHAFDNIGDPYALAVSFYVIPKCVERKSGLSNPELILSACSEILKKVSSIEPTPAEIELAANFEEGARTLHLELDIGESQLLAILIARNAQLMVTGDKRAISAIEPLIEIYKSAHNKIACFEQAIMEMLRKGDLVKIRSKICNEDHTDRALALCFSCKASTFSAENVEAGLLSYINSVRGAAPKALIKSDDLSSLTT